MNTHRILMLILIAAAVCVMSAVIGTAEDVNLTLEGHFGGATYVTAVSGNYAYIGLGQDLVVSSIGTQTVTTDMYADTTLLDSNSKTITVSDPLSVKFVEDEAESLKRTAISDFDKMAGIPASATSNLIINFGFNKTKDSISNHLSSPTDALKDADTSGSITDSGVNSMINDTETSVIGGIESKIDDKISASIIKQINSASGTNIPEKIDIFHLRDSVSSLVFEQIKNVFENVLTNTIKDYVVKPVFTQPEEDKVILRDDEFDSYAESFEYTVTADGTIFTLLSTDKLYYSLTEPVTINTTVNDILFNATSATVNVIVSDPFGSVAYPTVTGSLGHYSSTYVPSINGTYDIVATSTKAGFRSYDDTSFVIVGQRSVITTDLDTNYLPYNESSILELQIINDHSKPIDDAIVTLTGCGVNSTKITGSSGNVSFSITPSTTGTITLAIEKGGYAGSKQTLTVFEVPTINIVSLIDGTTVTTSSITVTGIATDNDGVTNLTVTIVATDAAGNSATETLTITYSAGDADLVFAITPNSRLAQVGTPVTIFLSVINAGTGNATGVSISQASSLPATISYQAWDGATLTGAPNTPVDIGSGETANFVLTIDATAEFASSPMTFDVSSTNGATAPVNGVNILTMAASTTPYADVIMMSTSLDVSTAVNTATAFAVATTNVGSASATDVSLVVDIPSSITGLSYQVNETNLDGSIKGPAAGLTIPVGGTPTFAVFLTPTQAIDYDPANNRIMLKLVDGSGTIVGAQSVAVSTT